MKRFVTALIAALVAAAIFVVPAFADTPSQIDVEWADAGYVTGRVATGDSVTEFSVDTLVSSGHFTYIDSNDNPYSYGVDTNSAYITTSFFEGAVLFRTTRTSSYTPVYGPAGQYVEAGVFSTGSGSMSTGSWTNYAGMVNTTYGKPWLNGANFTATDTYNIYTVIGAPSGNYAGIQLNGTGSASVNCMTTQAGAVRADLGWGGGCYTNAKVNATGSGWYTVRAYGTNGLATPIAGVDGSVVPGGIVASGASSLSVLINFTSGLSVGNFSVATK